MIGDYCTTCGDDLDDLFITSRGLQFCCETCKELFNELNYPPISENYNDEDDNIYK